MRICPSCKISKSLDEYGIDRNRKDGKNCYCKECIRLSHYSRPKKKRKYDPIKTKERRSKRTPEIKARDSIAKRDSMLRIRYGISLTEYGKLFDKQKGCCAICEIHQGAINKALAVDHNHVTGKIRGLLCSNCNRMLGFLEIDTEDKFINNLIKYPRGR